MAEIIEEFRYRLEKALNAASMKPIDLSEKTGISQATISQYRSGYSKPKDKRLVLIAHALGVDPSWLMGLDVPMTSPAKEDAIAPNLKSDEQHLLSAFRGLSDIGKKKVIQYTDGLYSLEHQEQELFAAHHREGVTQVSDHDRAIMEDDSKWEE